MNRGVAEMKQANREVERKDGWKEGRKIIEKRRKLDEWTGDLMKALISRKLRIKLKMVNLQICK